jgi:hypothetical protein
VRTYIFVTGLLISTLVAAGCGAVDALVPDGNRTDFARAVGYTVSSPDGVHVTLISPDRTLLATGHWEAATNSLAWFLDDGAVGSLAFDRFTPTEDGVAALVYTQWTGAHPQPSVTCASDGTCTTHQELTCEFNCMFWTGDTYANCWCGCNPGSHDCSYGCCLPATY